MSWEIFRSNADYNNVFNWAKHVLGEVVIMLNIASSICTTSIVIKYHQMSIIFNILWTIFSKWITNVVARLYFLEWSCDMGYDDVVTIDIDKVLLKAHEKIINERTNSIKYFRSFIVLCMLYYPFLWVYVMHLPISIRVLTVHDELGGWLRLLGLDGELAHLV